MAITEEARHRLFQKLEATIGPEEAAILMEHLPPVGWADVATKRDLDQVAAATKRDLDQVAAATKRDLDDHAAATKRDLDHHAAVFKRDLDHLDTSLRAEIRHESDVLRVELANGFRSQLQWILGYVTLLNGALFAALKLTA